MLRADLVKVDKMKTLMTATTNSTCLKRLPSREGSNQMIYHWPFREQMTSFRIITERLCLKEETNNNNIKIKDIIIYKKIKELHLTKQDQ